MNQIDYIKTLIFTYKASKNICYLRQARTLYDAYRVDLEAKKTVLEFRRDEVTKIMAA